MPELGTISASAAMGNEVFGADGRVGGKGGRGWVS